MKTLDLKDLQSDTASVKYHCAKRAIAVSEKIPKSLYPKLQTFIRLLDGDNRVLRWVAIIIIGNLSKVDTKNTISKLVPRLTRLLHDKEMITANNAIKALGKIAKARPR